MTYEILCIVLVVFVCILSVELFLSVQKVNYLEGRDKQREFEKDVELHKAWKNRHELAKWEKNENE